MVAQGFGLTAEQGLSIPHFLVGTEEQIIETCSNAARSTASPTW